MSQPSTCGLHASFAITVSRPSRSDDLEQPAQQLLARESPTAPSASTAATISSSDRSSTVIAAPRAAMPAPARSPQ